MVDYSLYQRNITEFPAKDIPQVHIPKSLDQLREVLMRASDAATPVYAISTGHNWGLGSKLPVVKSDIIDLRYFNKILEVNKDLAYARIQPGVTQRQLSLYLQEHAPDLMLNVTGSDAGSSILANALERGSGKNGHRAEDVRELKVLLADGSEVSTGYGSVPGNTSSFYKYGLGPDLTHLFTQSNYGIITEGVVSLMPKQPFTLHLVRFQRSQMSGFLERFSSLTRRGLVGYSMELDSSNDPKIYELFEDSSVSEDTWIGWYVVYGDLDVRMAKNKVILRELQDVLTESMTYESEESHEESSLPIKVRLDRYSGVPNDHSLTASARAFGADIDDQGGELDVDLYDQMPGFRCVLPVIPFSKQSGIIVEFIYEYSEGKSFTPSISIIALNSYSLEAFVRVYFKRSDAQEIQRAADWASGLLYALKDMHIYPYRLDVENMEPYLKSLEDGSALLKKKIKDLLDPQGIISPGRYII